MAHPRVRREINASNEVLLYNQRKSAIAAYPLAENGAVQALRMHPTYQQLEP